MQQSQFSAGDSAPLFTRRARCTVAGAAAPAHCPHKITGHKVVYLFPKWDYVFWIKLHSRLNLSANAVSAVQMSQPLPISDYVMSEADMVPLCRSTWSRTFWTSEFILVTGVVQTYFFTPLESWFLIQRWTVDSVAANKGNSPGLGGGEN